ncbi:phage tail tube protein [Hoeflea sp.]|uniref:phage tail tube protein n=1 Tax=Hoeflea sp. TaxID=1940281 RepID=UPI003BB1DA99
MPRYLRKLALLAKIEATYGTDSTPTGAANAMQVFDVSFTPLEGQEESRDIVRPYMGNTGVILTGIHQMIEFGVEISGAGAAGDVPGYGALLRACGLSETVTAETDVVYEPVSDGFEAVTLYYLLDGVRHIMLGCRGNVTMDFTSKRIPRFRFRMMGLLGTVADQALPATTFTGFATPVPVSEANTTFSLHGYAGATESVSFDLGNQVEPRLVINHESIEITDRRASGSAVMEATTLATKNWQAIALGHTDGVLALAHGGTAGNIVEVDAPVVQIGRYSESSSQGILNHTLPLMLKADSGDDDLTITVR